jgi:hypothetical protein
VEEKSICLVDCLGRKIMRRRERKEHLSALFLGDLNVERIMECDNNGFGLVQQQVKKVVLIKKRV